ncbi:epoxide hydrolase family protein [Leifsonia poae]|uniref:epoxide hydrolase family protein n=1 Tax=Leifsonia poae TaxID=110933 RepID=UPI003D678734
MTDTTDIRPFRMQIDQSRLDDLDNRLAATRWPDELPGVGWSYGVPANYARRLADYWQTGYDWREAESRLNAFPQFTTQIDGQNVHFLHVRSPEPGALPLILTHGWPGSIAEFEKIIGPLTDPAAHGGDPADAFHVVAPSIPGFGFSGPTTETGWDLDRVARAWAELMHRLGYDRYGAQGGDSGSVISPTLGRLAPEHVVGVHVNGGLGFPTGDPAEFENLTPAELGRLAQYQDMDRSGYAIIQSTRPQTLAFGLEDSPAGQLAWIVEKFKEWTDPARELPEDAVDIDQLLTNVSIYWFTETAASSARLYKEGQKGWGATVDYSAIPTAWPCSRATGSSTHRGAGAQRRALVGVRSRRPLRRDGGARPAGAGHPGLLPIRARLVMVPHPVTDRVRRPRSRSPLRAARCRASRRAHPFATS